MRSVRSQLVTRFPALTPGYIGRAMDESEPATLNARILSELYQRLGKGESVTLFPQRIPRLRFFEELKERETPEASAQIGQHQEAVLLQFNQALSSNKILAISLGQYALRVGLSKSMIGPLNAIIPNSIENLKLLFVKELALSQIALHESKVPDPTALITLRKIAQELGAMELAAVMAARFTVQTARYGGPALNQNRKETAQFLEEYLKGQTPKSPREAHEQSVMWRGLAMAQGLSAERVQLDVEKAVTLANTFKAQTPCEAWIQQELLLTTTQTSARVALSGKRNAEALAFFQQMTELDPYDSTGWSELGLQLSRVEKWSEAAQAFTKAQSLGPPGMAMNAYFAGKCYAHLAQFEKAKENFWLSAKWDACALSPRLELIEQFQKTLDRTATLGLVNEIFASKELVEQLETEERKRLQELCEKLK